MKNEIRAVSTEEGSSAAFRTVVGRTCAVRDGCNGAKALTSATDTSKRRARKRSIVFLATVRIAAVLQRCFLVDVYQEGREDD